MPTNLSDAVIRPNSPGVYSPALVDSFLSLLKYGLTKHGKCRSDQSKMKKEEKNDKAPIYQTENSNHDGKTDR